MNDMLFEMPTSAPPEKPTFENKAEQRRTITVQVDMDETLAEVCKPFDYSFTGQSFFVMPQFDAPPWDGSWSIGLIVGPSGSGKSQLLRKHYGETAQPEWNPRKAVASQLGTPEKAIAKLSAVGLNSVPSWCRPFHVLSNGEQFRANMARMLDSYTAFDEFTSVVDRTVAKSCSHAIQRHIRNEGLKGVVFCTCHYDIAEWLQPDWTFDTLTGQFSSGRSLHRRPPIVLTIEPCSREWWNVFKYHHYLSSGMNTSAETYLARWTDDIVGFTSCLAMPHADIKRGYREHRTVVLPDFQGLGIGVRLSDWLGARCLSLGRRFYSRTSHIRMASYRNASPLWRKTSASGTAPPAHTDRKKDNAIRMANPGRVGFSHEYIGQKAAQ